MLSFLLPSDILLSEPQEVGECSLFWPGGGTAAVKSEEYTHTHIIPPGGCVMMDMGHFKS